MHSTGVARIALLIGRVRRLPRSSRHGGTPGERQDDEKRGKPSLPVLEASQTRTRTIRSPCDGRCSPDLGAVLNRVQPTRSETGIMQAAALRGQIHPSAYTNATRVTVQTISAA